MVVAASVLYIEAQEACKEFLGYGTGLANTKQKFGHVENFRKNTYMPIGFCSVKWQLGKI